MKTYYRTVKKPVHMEEDERVFDLKEGEQVLTSEIREGKGGVAVVTVLAGFWVMLPVDHFAGGEAAYGHGKGLLA